MTKRQALKIMKKVTQWEFRNKEYGVPFPIRWVTYNKAWAKLNGGPK